MKRLVWVVCLFVLSTFASRSLAQTTSSPLCGWNPDFNSDLTIGTADLLGILNLWSDTDSDADGVWDSVDDCVGEYDGCGICNGDGSDADSDGVCDDIDLCVGAFDACGVCNGSGPTVPVLDEILFVTDSIYIPPIQQWYVFNYAVDTLYTFECPVQGCMDANAANFNPQAVIESGSCTYGPAQCGGASTVTFDGYTYALVGIGNQCWFKENLRSDNYRDGGAIPFGAGSMEWAWTYAPMQGVYDNNALNLLHYGRLYKGYAVISGDLCPAGFHVPTADDWIILENFLGGSSVAGSTLKSTFIDVPSWDGNNQSGFSAQPGGVRTSALYYYDSGIGISGSWWSSTFTESNSLICRTLGTAHSVFSSSNSELQTAMSVRCIRD